ncbi:MAG: formyltetrahydrofolate deformylase [Pseudomonadota bacterium]|nr:formyltetrahydrofolate deformylase [Pseudomonadota bacterium]
MHEKKSANAILLLSCQDQKGLVYNIANFIYRHNGNIVHAAQHTSMTRKIFFMRIEWELDGFVIPREEIGLVFKHVASQFQMTWDLHFTDAVPRLAIFASHHPHCLYDLLLRRQMGEFKADIPLVISNHPDVQPLVEKFGIKFLHFPITSENKGEQEERELKALRDEKIDLVVLARYMQVLTGGFISEYPNRIINIHHSFLPAFAGPRPYQQAYDRGVKIIGATSHYVTEQLDDGPIIAQDVIKITHRDSMDDIKLKSRDLERVVLAKAVRLHLENRILTYGSKTVVFE